MDQIESEIEQVYAGSRKKKLDRDVRVEVMYLLSGSDNEIIFNIFVTKLNA